MTDFEESHRIAGDAVRSSRNRGELAEALNLLADVVVRAVPDGEDDSGFIAGYVQGTGSIHAAIPFLQRYGVTVRPGFDGRKDSRFVGIGEPAAATIDDREALAKVIYDQIGTNITVHTHGTPKAFISTERIADAILAAGFRRRGDHESTEQ